MIVIQRLSVAACTLSLVSCLRLVDEPPSPSAPPPAAPPDAAPPDAAPPDAAPPDAAAPDLGAEDMAMEARRCRAEARRCNGDQLQVCALSGDEWETLACPSGQLCVTEGDESACRAAPRCGNGVREGSEGCDDGNVLTESCAYGEAQCQVCDALCALVPGGGVAVCGDGVVNGPEACDETSPPCVYGDAACVACVACQWVPGERELCGDGVVNGVDGVEACDEVSPPCAYGDAACVACVACQWVPGERELCGDGVVNGPEECDGQWFCGADCRFRAPCASSEGGCPDVTWVKIEGGRFFMGDEAISYARPVVEVNIEYDYHLSRSEVTVAQYMRCVEAGGCSLPTPGAGCLWGAAYADHPINCVTTLQMGAFARWVGATLPSEAEWEFAAQSRAPQRRYPWGDEVVVDGSDPVASLCQRGSFSGSPSCRGGISPVCSFPLGMSEQGLCDLMGNLEELVLDRPIGVHTSIPLNGLPVCGDSNTCLQLSNYNTSKGYNFYSREIAEGVHWYASIPRYRLQREREMMQIFNYTEFYQSHYQGFRLRLLNELDTPIGALCGDGVLSGEEECDDGNWTLETCPYGEEACQVCNERCELVAGAPGRCGDGFVNLPSEGCDGQSFCQTDCQLPPCAAAPGGCPRIEWIRIEGGTFEMGSTLDATQQPVHSVSVSSFEIMKSEITVGMYTMCVNSGFCPPPNCSPGVDRYSAPWCTYDPLMMNYPVNWVSWHNIMYFASWVGARLPTEAEWEFAASNRGESVLYPWGDSCPTCEYAEGRGCDVGVSCNGAGTSVVCNTPLGNTRQGVCDMTGNVMEFVQDEYHSSYEGAPSDGSGWCTGICAKNSLDENYNPSSNINRVFRGGNWYYSLPSIRSRTSLSSTYTRFHAGGRLARNPIP
ncbi:MAG: hypothetical protein FJ138_02785 [Deltaproteobacteria bacterium]|nr:hypothetical protein [Deltaproteobacteria bacterium]